MVFTCSGIVRVPAGWIGDRKGVNRNGLTGAMAIYCGILTMASTSFTTFTTMAIFSALFGFGAGLTEILYSIKALKHFSQSGPSMLSKKWPFPPRF